MAEFAPRFMEEYCVANRLKPSGIKSKESILRVHLLPFFGHQPMEQISKADLQRLKAQFGKHSSKTVNNVLTVLNKVLATAYEWGELSSEPVRAKMLKVRSPEMAFYEPEDFEALVEAADKVSERHKAIVLLGGEAGLRRGEMQALRWCDVDHRRNQLHIRQNLSVGVVVTPKSGRGRQIRMTQRLQQHLTSMRHLRSELVLCNEQGEALSPKIVRTMMAHAQRLANLEHASGKVHILRHTFCSHLAMKGAPALAIMQLAGHAHLTTTMRYMHLSPSSRNEAIQLLDPPQNGPVSGDILETAPLRVVKR